MEHILIYILRKLYWVLIYCFTIAGQVSLSDNMFCDSKQWAYEEIDNADIVLENSDSKIVSSVGMTLHPHSSISLSTSYPFLSSVVLRTQLVQRLSECALGDIFECPQRHRVRLRFCSD